MPVDGARHPAIKVESALRRPSQQQMKENRAQLLRGTIVLQYLAIQM